MSFSIGLGFAFLSAVFGSSKDLVSKRISFSVDGVVSAFASFVYALPFYLVALAGLWIFGYENFTVSGTFVLLVLLRSGTDAVAEWCKMTSFSYGDISLVSPFLSLSPLFLLVLGPLIAGDSFTLRGGAGVGLIALGTLLSTFQERAEVKDGNGRRSIIYALGFAFFAAVNTCLDRLAVHQASPTFSGFLMTLLAALPFLPGMFRRRDRLAAFGKYWRPFTLRGFMEIGFMVSKLYALKFIETAYVVGIQRSSIIVSIVGGRVLFAEKHFMRRLSAGALILAGVVLIVLR